MRKLFYIFLLTSFMYSCSNPLDFRNESDIEDINLDSADIMIDLDEEDIINQTTEEDIDELIDILFDMNIN